MVAAIEEEGQPVPQAPISEVQRAQSRVPLSFSCQRARWRGHDIGRMDIRCTGCNALHWIRESTASRRPRGGEASFNSCCMRGQVQIEPMRPLPEPLNTLINGETPEAKSFREGLRRWNSIISKKTFAACISHYSPWGRWHCRVPLYHLPLRSAKTLP